MEYVHIGCVIRPDCFFASIFPQDVSLYKVFGYLNNACCVQVLIMLR